MLTCTHTCSHMYLFSLAAFFKREKASVLELGAGFGCYTDYLLRANVSAIAFDGVAEVHNLTGGLVSYADLTARLDLGTADWVLNLAVAEHVPRTAETTLIDNLSRHARRGIVITWGNSMGNGHVNNRNASYVRTRIEERGFVLDASSSKQLGRDKATSFYWFKHNVLVFRRMLT